MVWLGSVGGVVGAVVFVIEFDEVAILFEDFDWLPSGFLEGEVLPLGEVEHFAAEDSATHDFFHFVGLFRNTHFASQ